VKLDLQLLHDVLARRSPGLVPIVPSATGGSLHRDVREAMRDALTRELAERGFDEQYELTEYGVALEGLIDALAGP
jgi:hypothetical protein